MDGGTFLLSRGGDIRRPWWKRLLRRPREYWIRSTEEIPYGASAEVVQAALNAAIVGSPQVTLKDGVYLLSWCGELCEEAAV